MVGRTINNLMASQISNVSWIRRHHYSAGMVLAVLVVVDDQICKLRLDNTFANPGGVLGVALPNSLLALLQGMIVMGGCVWVWRHRHRGLSPSVILVILISSISNLIDRVQFGYVVDYIQLIGVWFNLADLVVSVGLIILIWMTLRHPN